mmetsp:Transcript_17347/g.48373  ORF Transcript_17347/g.48373 Transcript_17347/m.48373 type:complete len:245 (+) Transcript_17347:742-1476(+)
MGRVITPTHHAPNHFLQIHQQALPPLRGYSQRPQRASPDGTEAGLRRLKTAFIICLSCFFLHIFMLGARGAIMGPLFALDVQRAILYSFPWFVLGAYLPHFIPLVALLYNLRARPPHSRLTFTAHKYGAFGDQTSTAASDFKQYPIYVSHAGSLALVKQEGNATSGQDGRQGADAPSTSRELQQTHVETEDLIDVDTYPMSSSEGFSAHDSGHLVPSQHATDLRNDRHHTGDEPITHEAELSFL